VPTARRQKAAAADLVLRYPGVMDRESMNQWVLTAMCLLISFTLGGLSSQIGVLVNPLASAFGLSQTDAAAQFSWLTGGILAGNVLAIPLLRRFNMRRVVAWCYLLLIGCTVVLHATSIFRLVPLLLTLIGAAAGVGVCAASTIIAQIWSGKRRQSALVAQDAFFNSGGMVFPALAGFMLSRSPGWSWGFVNVAVIGAVIVGLALLTRFDGTGEVESEADGARAEWPFGLWVAGASLFTIIVCFVTVTIWLPVYVQEAFGVSSEASSLVISKIFVSAFFGSIVFTFVVMKIAIHRFIAGVVLIGCIASAYFVQVDSFEAITNIAFAYGLAIAAVYHSFIALGLSFTQNPSYRHVTFLYICPGVGGAIAPVFSSRIVDQFGIEWAFYMASILYGLVLAAVLLSSFRPLRAAD
jgi:TsgA-like MFS transporter